MVGLNQWLLLAAALAVIASASGGVYAGKKIERADWLMREQDHLRQVQAETERANQVARIYGESLVTAQEKANLLRRAVNDQKEKLASCRTPGDVLLSGEFVRLYDAALQTPAGDSGGASGPPTGASPSQLLGAQVENGMRWKGCRDQLNALIDILERKK